MQHFHILLNFNLCCLKEYIFADFSGSKISNITLYATLYICLNFNLSFLKEYIFADFSGSKISNITLQPTLSQFD